MSMTKESCRWQRKVVEWNEETKRGKGKQTFELPGDNKSSVNEAKAERENNRHEWILGLEYSSRSFSQALTINHFLGWHHDILGEHRTVSLSQRKITALLLPLWISRRCRSTGTFQIPKIYKYYSAFSDHYYCSCCGSQFNIIQLGFVMSIL